MPLHRELYEFIYVCVFVHTYRSRVCLTVLTRDKTFAPLFLIPYIGSVLFIKEFYRTSASHLLSCLSVCLFVCLSGPLAWQWPSPLGSLIAFKLLWFFCLSLPTRSFHYVLFFILSFTLCVCLLFVPILVLIQIAG